MKLMDFNKKPHIRVLEDALNDGCKVELSLGGSVKSISGGSGEFIRKKRDNLDLFFKLSSELGLQSDLSSDEMLAIRNQMRMGDCMELVRENKVKLKCDIRNELSRRGAVGVEPVEALGNFFPVKNEFYAS